MKETAKNSTLFFFLILTAYFISGIAVKGIPTYASTSDTPWKTTCQKAKQVKHSPPADNIFSWTKDTASSSQQPVQLTNCSTSLQILPAKNIFLLKPDQRGQRIHNTPSFLTSQIFVFQEPDPPRLG